MHLGIIEFCEKNHHSMIFNWVNIANYNKWEISLFLSKEIYENVRSELVGLKYNLYIKDTNNFIYHLKIKKIVKFHKIDKLIFLTICNYLSFLFISFKSINFGISVHNADTWFNGLVVKNYKHYLIRFIINKLKNDASFFIANSRNIKNFIKKNNYTSKNIYVIPFSLRRKKMEFIYDNASNFTVVYPGSINHERRKYENFMKLAKINSKDKFIVLGSCRNNKVDINLYNQMKKISNIKLYEEYIEIDEFQKVMQNSNLLFTDLNTNYKSSYISEVYGISKDSGISYLMCEFNLPCLLNGDFNNFEELNSGSLYFNSLNEMSKKYYKIKNDIEYRKKIFNNMSHDTKKFNIEYFSEYLKKKFLENNLF